MKRIETSAAAGGAPRGTMMALYLAEVYFKEGFRRGYEAINHALTGGFPPRREAQSRTMGFERRS
jgi:hypothetical protein